MRERNILIGILLIFGLVLTGLIVGSRAEPLPIPGTERAQQVNQLLKVLFGLAAAVLLAVEGLLVVSALRGRLGWSGSKVEPSLELLWILLPSVLVVVLSVYSVRVLVEVETPATNPLVVQVNASQYEWSFRYLDAGVTSGELHLPLGRPVELRLLSADVVHSFWVPEFGGKVDAIPGTTTSFSLTPRRIGDYQAVCAEYCGTGHGEMVAPVIVEGRGAFDQWLAGQ